MCYGFVRDPDWSKTTNDGKLVTNVDHYRSYLLVIDRASRYIWILFNENKTSSHQTSGKFVRTLEKQIYILYCHH